MVYGRVKRALGRDSIVIVDGMNYIKGWRYQLWCESKSAGTTCCVVGQDILPLDLSLPRYLCDMVIARGVFTLTKRGLALAGFSEKWGN